MALQRPSFTTSRFVETYDMAEVDDAIDRIFDALDAPAPTLSGADVQAMRFTPTRLREGYSMDEVDTWLDEAVAELHRLGSGQRRGAVPAEPVADSAPAPTTYVSAHSDAIVEVPRGSTRWLAVSAAVLVLAAAFYVFYASFA